MHDNSVGFFTLDHRTHVLKIDRLEIEHVGSIVVGGYGLRIVVDDIAVLGTLGELSERNDFFDKYN